MRLVTVLVILAAVLGWAFIFWLMIEADAMATCREKHSFETCHSALHR